MSANETKLNEALVITASTWSSSETEALVNTCLGYLTKVTNLTIDLSGSNLFTTVLPSFPTTVLETLSVDMSGNSLD